MGNGKAVSPQSVTKEKSKRISLTVQETENVFTEWERRSRKKPAEFASVDEVAATSSRALGRRLSATFIDILTELRGKA